jgi:hypothetical protein
MLDKNACLSMLIRLEDQGININTPMKKLITSREVPLEVLRFISDNRGIEASNFYEMLRKKHNQSKSKLYTNIVKEIDDPVDCITTLNCLLTQILLYAEKLQDKDKFFKEVRAEEISRVINEFFKDDMAERAITLLKLIKSDLLVLEYIAGRRELA